MLTLQQQRRRREERLWIDQSGTLATKVTESRHRGTASRFLQTGGF